MFEKIVVLVLSFSVISNTADEENFQVFLKGNKQFAAETYKQVSLQKSDENFLFCPFSAETILALALNGAKDETYEEIQNALHFPSTTEKLNAVFKTHLSNLKNNEDNSYTLYTANRIYVKQNYPIEKNFSRIATKIYKSGIQNIDFNKKKRAAKTINNWVSKHTQEKIKNLVDSEMLNQDTVAILINALYFQGSWRKNFKKTLTRHRDFYATPEDVIQVETMWKTDFYGYLEDENLDAKFLQIPIQNGRDVKVVFVLPNEKDGLEILENRIGDVYDVANLTWTFVEVALPKFKIETSVNFKEILQNLGVNKAFSRADFSGIGGEKGEIYISEVVQKAFIDVNEDGIEAAAATGVLFHAKSLIDVHGFKKNFIADHPFLFYIKINEIVIFTGRIVNPDI